MAKFLLRSHFLSIHENMTTKQHISHVAIQIVYHFYYGIFHSIPFHLRQTLSILLYRLTCVIQ